VQHYVYLATYSVRFAECICGSFDKTFLLSDTFGEIILSPMTSFTESVGGHDIRRNKTLGNDLIYRECY
jgi:hypothetical protein